MIPGAPRRSLPVLPASPPATPADARLPVSPAPTLRAEAPGKCLSVGFVLPFGEAAEGFFPDALLELCCARARELGHNAHLVRVYYDGDGAAGDSHVRERLSAWLEDHHIDLVVAERVFDPAPITAHLARSPGRRAALISWGDGDTLEGFDLVIGRTAGRTRGDHTRRSPSAGDLVLAFEGVLRALATGNDPALTPGVAHLVNGTLVAASAEADSLSPLPDSTTADASAHPRSRARGSAAPREPAPPKSQAALAQGGAPAPLPRPFRPALDHDVIAAREPPPVTRKYLFGNAGCPFGDDPADNPHYQGLDLHASPTLARLGCAFCPAGGDYQKRADADVIDELIEQAAFYQSRLPDLRDLVLVDQHAPRLLAPLLREADARGLRPARWLFSARADAFVRDLPRVREALSAASPRGHRLELYLSGFEAFCDRELLRYNKGADVATLLRAVRTMRALAREHTATFGCSAARGHSLILWSPWTTPDDLLETTAHLRAEGLLDLFDDIGKNRLRLYEDLPITLAAARDGAVTCAWDEGDEGAARQKGYAVERPWSFLDRRTRLAFTLARGLRRSLGPTTELPQLEAAARFAQAHTPPLVAPETATLPPAQTLPLPAPETATLIPPLPAPETATLAPPAASIPGLAGSVLAEVRALSATMRRLAEGGGRAPVLGSIRAGVVLFGGACNNGCAACANRDRHLEDDEATLLARIDEARAHDPDRALVLAGREPSIHPAILRLVAHAASGPRPTSGAARGPEARLVGLVTNGRRLAYRPFSQAILRAGLGSASVKIFAPDAATADAIARDTGAHDQSIAALAELARVDLPREIRLPLHRLSLATLPLAADLAARTRAHGLRLEAALDAIGLDHLREAHEAIDRLEARCLTLGVPLTASRLESGTRAFDALPSPSRRR